MDNKELISVRKLTRRIQRGIPDFERKINDITRITNITAQSQEPLTDRVLRALFYDEIVLSKVFSAVLANSDSDTQQFSRDIRMFDASNSRDIDQRVILASISNQTKKYFKIDPNGFVQEFITPAGVLINLQQLLFKLYSSNLKEDIIEQFNILKDANIAIAKIDATSKRIVLHPNHLYENSQNRLIEHIIKTISPKLLTVEKDNLDLKQSILQVLSLKLKDDTPYDIVLSNPKLNDPNYIIDLMSKDLPQMYTGDVEKVFRAFTACYVLAHQIDSTYTSDKFSESFLQKIPVFKYVDNIEINQYIESKLNRELLCTGLSEDDLVVGFNILKELISIINKFNTTKELDDSDLEKFGFYDTEKVLMSFKGIPIIPKIKNTILLNIYDYILTKLKSLQSSTTLKVSFEHPTLSRFKYAYATKSKTSNNEKIVATVIDGTSYNELYFNGKNYIYKSNTGVELLSFESNAESQEQLEVDLQEAWDLSKNTSEVTNENN